MHCIESKGKAETMRIDFANMSTPGTPLLFGMTMAWTSFVIFVDHHLLFEFSAIQNGRKGSNEPNR